MSSASLIVVGRGKVRDPFLEEVDAIITAPTVRCSNAHELVTAARNARGGVRQPLLDRIDIIDHGSPGDARLGGATLFGVNEYGTMDYSQLVVLNQLCELLSPTGHLRLLGCVVADSVAGDQLLRTMGDHMGADQVVLASLFHLMEPNFGPQGFSENACLFLHSSRDVANGTPKAPDQRVKHCIERHKGPRRTMVPWLHRTAPQPCAFCGT